MKILNITLLVIAIGLLAWIGLSVAKVDLGSMFGSEEQTEIVDENVSADETVSETESVEDAPEPYYQLKSEETDVTQGGEMNDMEPEDAEM